jgi:hypothetical protein
MKNYTPIVYSFAALICLLQVGCASNFIKITPGSENISLQTAPNVGKCKSLGKVTVGVVAEVGFYTRSADEVEANLLQLARNSAVSAGADTVVKAELPEYGRRAFDLYKCNN